MVFETPTRFACGDYKPGTLPQTGTGGSTTLPSILVPDTNQSTQLFPPSDSRVPPVRPPQPSDPSYPGTGSPGGTPPSTGGRPTGGTSIGTPLPPVGTGTGTPTGGTTGPTGAGAGTGPTGPRTGGPGTTTPYTGPGDVTGGRRPAVTPTGARTPITRYKCMGTAPTYCADNRTINGYKIVCGPCERERYRTETAWIYDCRYTSKQACESSLHDPPCVGSRTTPDPCVAVTQTGASTGSSNSTQQVVLQNTAYQGNQVVNSQQLSFLSQQNSRTKNVRSVTVNSQRFKGYSSASNLRESGASLFDPYYNFFKTEPDPNTKLIKENNLYTNIFKSSVAYEVYYFLTRMNLSMAWHEIDIHNLTNDKIKMSLRDDLLTSILNIHTVGNKKVEDNAIIEVIKKHLLEGTLDEFDPNFYIYTYNSQIPDDVFEFDETGENRNTIDAAFGIFESLGVNPDYRKPSDDVTHNDWTRMRFLLDDLEAELPIQQLEGYESPLPLNTVGIPVELASPLSYINPVTGVDLSIGDGAGYYFSSMTLDGVEYPIMINHSLSDAYYLTPNDRQNVLKLFGKNGNINITVSSLPTIHEFSSSFNFSADVSPMYFALDPKTVGDAPNPNSVVNMISSTYRRLSDEEAAVHSRNYSFNIVKANVDHRDPFIHYARDSSSFYLEQEDFNLRAFDFNRSILRLRIMTRTVPHAIILCPGMGSYHNPFNGRSTVLNHKGDIAVRKLSFRTDIKVKDGLIEKPFLNRTKIYDTLSVGYHGLYEKYFDVRIHGDIYTYDPSSPFFDKSYYYDGKYTNVQPPSSMRQESIESKFLNLADKLTSLDGVNELTWWDIFRRLKLNQVGSLMYSNNQDLIKDLSLGYKNGVPIKLVLSRQEIVNTGIPDGTTIPDDKIIINLTDRYRDVQSY